MASFVVHSKGAPPTTFPLVKRLTSVGASAESDLRVPDVRGVVAIQFDGSTFTATALEGAELLVNGKKRGQHILSDGDTLELGATQLVFQSADRIPTPAEVTRVGRDPAALAVQRLAEFSAQLAREPALDKALARLLDSIVEVVKADKGFVLLVTDGAPSVVAARNLHRENIANAVERLSDSIVSRVLNERTPLIVSDALHDP